jgi:hypothetical protein
VWRYRNGKFSVCLTSIFISQAGSFLTGMRVYKNWLEYDVAALAFLIVGMSVVGLLALII